MTDPTTCEICAGSLSNRFCHGLNGDGPIVHVECETNARRIYQQPPPQPAASEAALRELLLEYERWLWDATELQVSSAEIDRFLAERAARAAAGGGNG